MVRILPLLLMLLIAAGAWRREAGVPKATARTREAHKTAVVSKKEECEVAAPGDVPAAVTVPCSPKVQAGGENRERRLALQVAALEVELREALEKVDEHRAKLAKLLNRRGPDPVEFLTQALIDSRTRVELLEAQIDVIETAYVELAARLRRSDQGPTSGSLGP